MTTKPPRHLAEVTREELIEAIDAFVDRLGVSPTHPSLGGDIYNLHAAIEHEWMEARKLMGLKESDARYEVGNREADESMWESAPRQIGQKGRKR